MVTVPAIFLGLIFLAGYAVSWVVSLIAFYRVYRRLLGREQAELLAILTSAAEEDDDDDDQGGGSLQPIHAL